MKKLIKPLCLLTGLLCAPAVLLHAQVDEKLKADIVSTGYVHSPLPLDETKAFETFGLKKKVLETVMLCDMEDFSKWSHKGIGKIGLTDERSKSGKYSLRLEAPAHPEKILGWGLGRGTCMASYDIGGVNWEGYNRLKFYIYPTCEGARSIYLNLYVENDGEIKVPDIYGREGYHEINLKNNQWNECFVEMSGLARDKVTKISFAIEVFGKERTMGDFLRFDVDAVELQKVENPETVKGWMPAQNRIIFSTTGYSIESPKSAIVNVEKHGGQFQLKDAATQAIVYTGPRLDKEHYLRIFPVWFSFKGNIAVHLSTGKAAAICARVLKDKELKDIAEQQLFWVVGRNPFGQSMIYGEGSNYPQLYTALPGETVGEIPVGMQSYFNEDAPYWPQFNTATYKEVWGSSAARWLMLVSEF